MESLPADASGTMRFRAKANIGLQHVFRGDTDEGVRWLLEAYEDAPTDPRAVANRALALWLKGEVEEAYRFGREQLAADPTNAALAGYLPQMAVMVPSVGDGLEGIPEALRGLEDVTIGQAIFLRGRDIRPDWWDWVRTASSRLPKSDALRVLAAISQVDETAYDEEFQRTQILSPDRRESLEHAVAILDADWQGKTWLLKNPYDDASHTLASAMIGHHFLHDRANALARAARIADEGLEAANILSNAVAIVHSYGELELAKRLLALAPDDPDLAFQAAVIAVQEDDWAKATSLYAIARIPECESRVAETVVALAPIKAAGKPIDGTDFDLETLDRLLEQSREEPRALILIASVASELGESELSRRAFEAAIEAVRPTSHIASRLMVAAYADRIGSQSSIIRLLDGHLPLDGFEREHERLAAAHANELPHRARNLAYFQSLPLAVRGRREIARAHASVLLDVGKLPEAASLLRRLHTDDPADAFVTLRLIEALHRSGDKSGTSSLLRRLDLRQAKGPPQYIMHLAHLMMRDGDAIRAYPVAYDLVRRHRDNAEVALTYLGLGLLFEGSAPIPDVVEAGRDACVTVAAPDGSLSSFVIDEGEEFFGIKVLAPSSGMAARVNGKRRGDTFSVPKLGFDPEVWAIKEVTSKYLHLHRQILDEFETRFPDKLGIARFTVEEGNIDAVLEVVRRRAEHSLKTAKIYLEQEVPLGFVARLLGGDVISFADYVRGLGNDIVTCTGRVEERQAAKNLARRNRGSGAVLDPYTAWVAAEIGMLPFLKAWFNALVTPASTLAMIDRLLEREREGLGRTQLTMAWHDGQFFRQEITDEHRHRQIEAISRVQTAILANCEVKSVLVPDEISEAAESILAMAGSRFLDSAFLAAENGMVLLSDDMRYRQWCGAAVGGEGLWLQAALLASLEARELTALDYRKAVIGLSAHRHGHVALTAALLYFIAINDEDGLPGLRTTLTRLAGPTAVMDSHIAVFGYFLRFLWPWDQNLSLLRTQAATGLALEAMLAQRKTDALPVLRAALSRVPRNRAASRYVASWLRGHFITGDILNPAPLSKHRAERSMKIGRRPLGNRGKRKSKSS